MASYAESTQRLRWTMSRKQLDKHRADIVPRVQARLEHAAAVLAGAQPEGAIAVVTHEPLTVQDEISIQDYYLRLLVTMCDQLEYPPEVKFTAATYFKRFYLTRSAAESDSTHILLASIFVAAKCEEVPFTMEKRGIDATALAASCSQDESVIRDNEVQLLEGIQFNLVAFHPIRPIVGFVRYILSDGTKTERQVLQNRAIELVVQSLYTDCMFLYSPSQIALAALGVAAQEIGADMLARFDKFLNDRFPEAGTAKAMAVHLEDVATTLKGGSTTVEYSMTQRANKRAKKARKALGKAQKLLIKTANEDKGELMPPPAKRVKTE